MFAGFKQKNNFATRSRLLGGLGRFQKSEDGGLLIFSLFILIIMLLITGLGVDLMRTETDRSRLQATLDRAILAGASLNQSLDSEDVVRDYFVKAGYSDAIASGNINITPTLTSNTVSVAVNVEVESIFLKMMGITSLSAPAGGTAEESFTDIEISLVVDTSGSMGGTSASGDTKINDLKGAAKEFVYLMQCDPGATPPFDGACTVNPDKVSISLVPYNEQVLLGEDLLQQFNTTEEHTNSSCIDFAASDYASVPVELDPLLTGGLADLTPNLRRSATIDPWSWGNNASTWRRTCSANAQRQVSALENSYQDLEVAIDGLYAGGYTSIELGMKWGSALLDPSFRPGVANMATNLGVVSPEFVGRPYDYDEPNVKKIIVLMTDGKNTTQHLVRDGFRDGPSPFYEVSSADSHDGHVSIYDAVNDDYFWVEHGTYHSTPEDEANAVQLSYPQFWDKYSWSYYKTAQGTASLPAAVDQVFNAAKNTRLDAMCNAAKAEGIVVYTMGFETSTASSQIMQACASSPSHHYDVSGLDIGQAFHSIANDIKSLRLTN